MKKINLVIIGTLAAALLLSGCEQEPKEPSAAEKSAAALAAELGEGVEVNGSTVTVKIGETVAINADKPVTVAEGVTFNVPASSAVSVGSGAEFTVTGTVAVASGGNFTVESNGTANVSGQLTVGSGNTPSNNVNFYNANYRLATSGNGILAEEGETDEGTLTVNSGGTLEVTGTVTVNGGGILDVAGTINIASTGVMNIENGGTYILQGGTENHAREAGTNNGTVYIKSGGVTHGKGGAVDGDGLNVVEVGGKALYTVNNQTTTMIDGTNSVEGAIFKFTTGTLSFNNWDYILDGNGTLASNFQLYSFRHQKLTVKQGSTLSIASGAKLIGQADADTPANTTQVVNNGTITFEGNNNSNFYPSNGNTAENPAANTTYKWSATAGGNSNAGWKAEASG